MLGEACPIRSGELRLAGWKVGVDHGKMVCSSGWSLRCFIYARGYLLAEDAGGGEYGAGQVVRSWIGHCGSD